MKQTVTRRRASGENPVPLPWSKAPLVRLAKVRALAFDIDGTLTTEGRLGPEAYTSLWKAREAGIALVAVTGRPAGWCDHFARMWPIDAVVGENGAFYFAAAWSKGVVRGIDRVFAQSAKVRAEHREQLFAAGEAAMQAVPGTRLAADQDFRLTDVAIDFAEDVGPFSDEQAATLAATLRAHGATAKISSIHVNAWMGRYDKRGMLFRVAADRLGLSAAQARRLVVYVGDSPNDAPLFSAVELSVGVANCRRFLDRLDPPPAYITGRPEGAGFAQLVRRLIKARKS